MFVKSTSLLILFSIFLFCLRGQAQTDGNNAAELYTQGERLVAQGEYAKALPLFERSASLDPSFPGTIFAIGICHVELNQHSKAVQTLDNFLDIGSHNERIQQAHEEINSALGHMRAGTLTVRAPAHATVIVDGAEISPQRFDRIRLSEGQHTVIIRGLGEVDLNRQVTISVQQTTVVELPAQNGLQTTSSVMMQNSSSQNNGQVQVTLETEGDPPPGDQRQPLYERWWFWTSIGGGISLSILISIIAVVAAN